MDLTFKTEYGRFNYRVGAIIIENNKLLMVKNEIAPYYYSVGGRVKLNEDSESAVLREVKEETGVDFEIDRLGFICENFFIEEISKIRFHEIGFYYFMNRSKESKLLFNDFADDDFYEGSSKNRLVWLPLDSLKDTYLYPEFLKTELLKKQKGIKHIIVNQIE